MGEGSADPHHDLGDVLHSAMENGKTEDTSKPNGETSKRDPELAASGSTPPRSPKATVRTASTPSARTGLPRSLDYISPVASRQNTANISPINEKEESPNSKGKGKARDEGGTPNDPYQRRFHRMDSEFRGALEYEDPEQREKEREAMEKKERAKRREITWLDPEAWNPIKWLSGETASPTSDHETRNLTHVRSESPTQFGPPNALARSLSHPAPRTPTSGAAPRWARLKSLLPQVTGSAQHGHPLPASQVVGKMVNITDELIAGGLSALMLRMWFERDERSARRIPVLLHRLRIRVSDSLHPLHGTKAVFRIEVCGFLSGIQAKSLTSRHLV